MLSPSEALLAVAAVCRPLPPRRVDLPEALGLVLAEPIRADRDCPPFPRAMMDGYAVRLSAAGLRVRVIGEAAAGRWIDDVLADGDAWEIMTGAACPPGTEAVVPKEYTTRDGNCVAMPARIAAGQHIAPVGSECRAGEIVIPPGEPIAPMSLAVMASFGVRRVAIVPRPRLGIIVTGAELAPQDAAPAPGQIRDSNGPMLAAMAQPFLAERPTVAYAIDTYESLRRALAATADCDLVALSAGVSIGRYDLVPEALRDYGSELVFHRVRQKPGKPLLLARRGPHVLFGLPGNSLACHFCFHRYVEVALRALAGRAPMPAIHEAVLTAAVPARGGRTYFIPGRAVPGAGGAPWIVEPLAGVSSADIFHSHRANCYLEVPPRPRELPARERVALTLCDLRGLTESLATDDRPWPVGLDIAMPPARLICRHGTTSANASTSTTTLEQAPHA
jgi:molybdenum cofactor synthesis domain-containing protein